MIRLVNISLVDANHEEDLVELDGVDAVVQSLVECDQCEGKLMQFIIAIGNYVVKLVSLFRWFLVPHAGKLIIRVDDLLVLLQLQVQPHLSQCDLQSHLILGEHLFVTLQGQRGLVELFKAMCLID